MNNVDLGDLTNQLLAQMTTQLQEDQMEVEDFWEDVNEEEEPVLELQGDRLVQVNNTNIENTVGGDTFYDTKSDTNKTDTEEKPNLENNLYTPNQPISNNQSNLEQTRATNQ